MKLKAKSCMGGGKTVKPKEESGVSPELERELLRLRKEAREGIKSGRIKPLDLAEHKKYIESL